MNGENQLNQLKARTKLSVYRRGIYSATFLSQNKIKLLS